MTSQEPLTIDIVSDVVCPWCYLGKVQLEEAIRLYGAPVITRWHPFQLDPTIPQGGVDRKAYMAKKFPDPSYLKEAHERLIALGIQRGLNFRFENIEKSPNTLDAHRLIYWAGLEGRQSEIVTMLFKAYFEEGFDIGNIDRLADIAAASGMDRDAIHKRLMSKDDRDTVKVEYEEAQRIGITGVPFFIFNRKIATSGAQPPEALLAAMRQAAGT